MRKKILREIHPLNLIKEVEKWPILYEKNSQERTNTYLKTKLWFEVGKALLEDWDTYSTSVKELKVKLLTKKWRNLRDTFKRHVERKSREGSDSKQKNYVYFKYMLFLLPHITPSDDPPEEPMPELDEYIARKRKSQRTKAKADKPKPTREETAAESAPQEPQPSKSSTTEETTDIDEDKHFLLSLVPTFKKMSDDEKLTAKMEILKVIKQVRGKSKNPQESKAAEDLIAYGPEPAEPIKVEFFNVEAVTESDSENSEYDSDMSV